MRVAFLIPHFFIGSTVPDGPRMLLGSAQPEARLVRRIIFERLLFQIHTLFGPSHAGLNILPRAEGKNSAFVPAGNPHQLDFDIFVFTSGDAHLLAEISGRYAFKHIETSGNRMFLGFECARWIRDCLGSYDFYFFLEDDLLIRDPLLLRKAQLFNDTFDAGAKGLLLQPQRYEETLGGDPLPGLEGMTRLYIDYQSQAEPSFAGETFTLDFAGMQVHLEPALCAHSGCYILNNAQATRMVEHPLFLDPNEPHRNPTDDAATLFISRALKIYKPARDSLSFFDIQHGHPRIIPLKTGG
jgi:hypothetical protein